MPRSPLGLALLPGMAAVLLCLRFHLPAAAWQVPARSDPQGATGHHPPAGSRSSLWVLPGLALPVPLASALLPRAAPRLPVRGPACPEGSLCLLLLQLCLPLLDFPPLAFLLLHVHSAACFLSFPRPLSCCPGAQMCSAEAVCSPSLLSLCQAVCLTLPSPLLTALLTPWDYFSFSPCLVAFGSQGP